MLDERVRKQVQVALAGMQRQVRALVFTQGEGGALECAYCSETRELMEEMASLSDKIALEVKDFQADADLARAHGVDKIPAIVLLGDGDQPTDPGIRFFGIPAGYEFSTLLEDLRMVSSGEHRLSEETLQAIGALKQPVHIQVFVTPT